MSNEQRLGFLSGNVIKFISPEEVLYCVSDKNYTDIFLASGEKVVTNKSLKELELIFDGHLFVRIHHSTIANIMHVESFKPGNENILTMADGKRLHVSRRKKQEFLSKFQQL